MDSVVDRLKSINFHLLSAIEQSSDGILILESGPLKPPGPKIIFVNNACVNITGFKNEELLGRPISILYDQSDFKSFLLKLPSFSKSLNQVKFDVITRCFDLIKKNLTWSISASTDDENNPVNFIINLKETPIFDSPSKIRNHRAKLEVLSNAAGGVSSEFNNGLTTIKANLSLALQDLKDNKGDENYEKMYFYLNSALKATNNARLLSRKLNKFCENNVRYKKITNLNEVVDNSAALSLSGSDIEYKQEIANDLFLCEIDSDQIIQALQNIFLNASQAMPKGGTISLKAYNFLNNNKQIPSLSGGKYVCITIHDRGKGIEEANLKKIFDPFFTTKSDGNGMGLSSSKNIIEDHKGKIFVTSEAGRGTEFSIFIPAVESSNSNTSVSKIRNKDLKMTLNSIDLNQFKYFKHILFIDHQVDILNAYRNIFEKFGSSVYLAQNSFEAMKIYKSYYNKNNEFPLVITDLILPGSLSGEEICSEIKSMSTETKVIASSSQYSEELEEKCLMLGFDALLPKPFDLNQIVSILNEIENVDHLNNAIKVVQ